MPDYPIFRDIRQGDLEAVKQHVQADAAVLEEKGESEQGTPPINSILWSKPAIALWLIDHRG